jgi:hypothetical protein
VKSGNDVDAWVVDEKASFSGNPAMQHIIGKPLSHTITVRKIRVDQKVFCERGEQLDRASPHPSTSSLAPLYPAAWLAHAQHGHQDVTAPSAFDQ